MSARILVVDDEPRNVRLLKALLEAHPYETATAANGEEALKVIEGERVDLVLLDLAMPGMDGLEVLRRIRARETAASRLPVVLVTAQTARESRLDGMKAGADEFLEKPIDRALLLTRVGGLLELKAARDELRVRHESLERLQRERQELTEFLVHDMKSPLGVITANLAFARESMTDASEDVLDALSDAREAAWRLAAMVQDLLTIAKLEQDQLQLRTERFDVADLLAEIARMNTRRAQLRKLSLVVQVEKGIQVVADRGLLRRVLENLTDNALRYTPAGGRIALLGGRSDMVEIAVANTGRPIPEEIRDKIFEKFFRGRDAGLGNAGLGLNFAKQVVAAHHGRIGVVDAPEWATRIAISLPDPQQASTG